MAQYRIGELAEVSGVNARNIRAYRERGLLDPPVRVGRAAIYNDVHLGQLRVIDQLLNKGFTSSHIVDFFAAVRSGHDLADVLGLQDVLGDSANGHHAEEPAALPFDADVTSGEARRMVATGLAYTVEGQLMLSDPALVRIVSEAPDRRLYLAILVEVFAWTRQGVAAAADDINSMLTQAAEELTPGDAPAEPVEAVRVLRDFRDLAAIVIARQVDEAVRRSVLRSSA